MNERIRIIKEQIKNSNPNLYKKVKGTLKRTLTNSSDYSKLLISRYERSLPNYDENKHFKEELKNCAIYKSANKADSIRKLLKNVRISTDVNDRFFYSLDVFKCDLDINRLIVNSTIDYVEVVGSPLSSLYLSGDSKFEKDNNTMIDIILNFANRCADTVKNSNHPNKEKIIDYLENMKNGVSRSLEEALQRILFINMLLWQTNHRLVGLGRLDLILNELYSSEQIEKDELVKMLSDFLNCLHEYYWFKSDALMGDTGQIIILGGNKEDGSYFCNDISFAFIEAVKKLHLPDPKILLRVGNKTPKLLIKESIECIATGIGCPLFSNDEQVIKNLMDFGYSKEDSYNYVTSACWEPLIPGVSHEQNNIGLYNFLLPIELLLEKEDTRVLTDFDSFFNKYCDHLRGHVMFINNELNGIIWEKDPLLSVLTNNCRTKKTDISEGGGKYNNYGVLSVAMSNAVNSLLIIKKYVYEDKLFELSELNFIRKNNYSSHEDIKKFLKQKKYFGTSSKEALELTNKIIEIVSEQNLDFKNSFGGKIKFGLSSPGYIQAAESFPPSFDGRIYGEPFAVHISGDDGKAYTELMEFASKIKYENDCFNGNVVDFYVTPNLINNNIDKFTEFMIDSFKMGVYQAQINVVSSETLIAAKKNPELYRDLIVRVWGFSAYYVQLPIEYQNYLIKRAQSTEGIA